MQERLKLCIWQDLRTKQNETLFISTTIFQVFGFMNTQQLSKKKYQDSMLDIPFGVLVTSTQYLIYTYVP